MLLLLPPFKRPCAQGKGVTFGGASYRPDETSKTSNPPFGCSSSSTNLIVEGRRRETLRDRRLRGIRDEV